MNRSVVTKSILIIALVVFTLPRTFASGVQRTVSIAGLVFNVQTMAPVIAAKIHGTNGELLGATDKNGYYNISFNFMADGDLYFKLKIVKDGFADFTQKEHWGGGDARNVMYFGLEAPHSGSRSFSSFAGNRGHVNDLSYANVLNHFDKVKKEKEFNDKLTHAKTGNEDVLVNIDGKFFIVDNSGWIQLNSDKDPVAVDGRVMPADQLNAAIKRKSVKWMSPVDSKGAKFAIRTR